MWPHPSDVTAPQTLHPSIPNCWDHNSSTVFLQVSLQFFDREKRPAKGWLGSTLGAAPDDRQHWETWCLQLAVAPPAASQHQQSSAAGEPQAKSHSEQDTARLRERGRERAGWAALLAQHPTTGSTGRHGACSLQWPHQQPHSTSRALQQVCHQQNHTHRPRHSVSEGERVREAQHLTKGSIGRLGACSLQWPHQQPHSTSKALQQVSHQQTHAHGAGHSE